MYKQSEVMTKECTSCVLSSLDYCNSLLMGTPNSAIQPMQKVQNTAARLILRAPRHQNCTPLLQQLHWLPISERIKYKTACMCYNEITGSAPSYLSELLYFTVLPALSALRQTHAFSKSNASTAKPMAFALLTLWPPHLEQSPQRHQATLSSFKSQLKTFLFSEYFS